MSAPHPEARYLARAARDGILTRDELERLARSGSRAADDALDLIDADLPLADLSPDLTEGQAARHAVARWGPGGVAFATRLGCFVGEIIGGHVQVHGAGATFAEALAEADACGECGASWEERCMTGCGEGAP